MKSDVKNYRPVCKSSIIPQLFDENIASQVVYPTLFTVIGDEQHGFMKKHSTATSIIFFSDFITNVIQICPQH